LPKLGLVGGVFAALVTAGVVTLRLATGQPLEGTGELVNRMLLGDLDDEARATMAVRRRFEADPDLTRIAGREGRVNAQMASVAEDLRRFAFEREVGERAFREEFPANNRLDMIILRARAVFLRAFNGAGGPGAVERFRSNYGEAINKARGKGGGR
jgi:hypothetical protein